MKNTEQSGARTLLLSLILSSPGPIVVGIGVLMGRSSTQLADFVRRSAELCAILVSYFIYRIIHKDESIQEDLHIDESKQVDPLKDEAENESPIKVKLERTANLCVGVAMCISGFAMLFIALSGGNTEKGNVMPGLIIALLGLATNSWFWLRYTKLAVQNKDAVLVAQSRLYRAKSFVDACVFIVLLIVTIAPLSGVAYWADIGGSITVSGYLIVNGIVIFNITHKSPSPFSEA